MANGEPPRADVDEEPTWRARIAAARFHHGVRTGLPPYVPGEPRGLASMAALRVAPGLLADLGRIHGVERWTWPEFRRAVLEGTLAPWKGGVVEEDGRTLRAAGPCPLADVVRRDPRACAFCREVQGLMARAALPGQVGHVRFERAGSRGRLACVTEVTRKAAPGAVDA